MFVSFRRVPPPSISSFQRWGYSNGRNARRIRYPSHLVRKSFLFPFPSSLRPSPSQSLRPHPARFSWWHTGAWSSCIGLDPVVSVDYHPSNLYQNTCYLVGSPPHSPVLSPLSASPSIDSISSSGSSTVVPDTASDAGDLTPGRRNSYSEPRDCLPEGEFHALCPLSSR
jgi:hypothetical protein